MIAHCHLDEGRDGEQFFLFLPQPGSAELAWLHRKGVGVDIAKRIADFIDDKRKLTPGAMAEIDRPD